MFLQLSFGLSQFSIQLIGLELLRFLEDREINDFPKRKTQDEKKQKNNRNRGTDEENASLVERKLSGRSDMRSDTGKRKQLLISTFTKEFFFLKIAGVLHFYSLFGFMLALFPL